MGDVLSHLQLKALATVSPEASKLHSLDCTTLGRIGLADIGLPRGPPSATGLLEPLFSPYQQPRMTHP